MHKFKDFIVWQKARELVKVVYQLTSMVPDEEKFGLISQINRAAVSIPANIAEGSGRKTDIDFCRFLDIANGSSFELETLLILCVDLSYLSEKDLIPVQELNQEIQKMIYSLKQKLNKN
ncbi:four helix bundle protein [Labilibaculum sp. A4]|uniref:four helix bundle protein n=1 Tax=Labilibaculum euxinus TaxID=2686357 RepID=UPI000F626C9E|nr:four helix bundle protein [Labilibaculum euxinus]MDQ1771643.1 four helix bundle protein [Labilibaculum euxinus]MWN77368.1 four helix bundle protein [Labilibaculum euxinus]